VERHAFDGLSADYDANFSEQQLGRWLRGAVWEVLDRAFAPGDAVLDLGCGTGEDALHLARRGVHVTALDASPGMLAVAEPKLRRASLPARVTTVLFDLNRLGQPDGGPLPFAVPEGGFQGAYSDFGPLNCVRDRKALSRGLAELIRPGGVLVAVVMGPVCPWELGWYLAHGHPRTATRRIRPRVRAQAGGAALDVFYPTPRRLRADLAPEFRHIKTIGVGALLPITDLATLVPRAPGLFSRLNALETRWRARFPLTWLNDHYLAVFERG
jgi:SAM-dependent methyltransferase